MLAHLQQPAMLPHCTSLSFYFSDGVNETLEGREVKAEQFGGCEEEPSRNKGIAWKSPSVQLKCPGMKEDAEDEGDGRRGPMRRMSRTRRKGRIRMTTVTTMNDESSFLPNGSAKLKCQTHDARMRMMRMLQRFSMIQMMQMTGKIKMIRMNQRWG